MVDSIDDSAKPSWTERWAVGVPVAAAVCVIFFARAWGVPWSGLSVAAVAVVGWLLAVAGRWGWRRGALERWVLAAAVVAAVGVVGYWAGWRLSRGLVMAAWPVLGLAVLEASFGQGRIHPLMVRLAMGGVTGVLLLGILVVPMRVRVEWPAGMGGAMIFLLRVSLAAGVVVVAAHVWQRAGDPRLHRSLRRVVRSVVFAAGVWLPLVWWHPRGLLAEFVRTENAAFLALVALVAWARHDPDPSASEDDGRRVKWAAVALAALAAGGWLYGWHHGMHAQRSVYEGVAVGALVLAAGVWWGQRRGRAAVGVVGWPELALIMMGLTAWIS